MKSLRQLLAEDVSVERAAALLDIEVSQARRLMKTAAPDAAQTGGSAPTGPVSE